MLLKLGDVLVVSANVDRRLKSRKSHLVVSHGRNRRQNVLLTLVHHHTSLTWLCDEELSLHIQVTTALVQSLLDLCLIVQDMMHLVVYHIVAELFTVWTQIFGLAQLVLVESIASLIYLTARSNCLPLLEVRYI